MSPRANHTKQAESIDEDFDDSSEQFDDETDREANTSDVRIMDLPSYQRQV